MCEVTSKNFEEKYPQIIKDLELASFISIDCEFSGLFDDNICSLFDSPKARFSKLQKSLKNFLIIQLGLSTFKYEKKSNLFEVSSYTFYLKPTSVLENVKFACTIESIEFLCKHGFDFNKLFYDGINYLNKVNEIELLRMIEQRSLADKVYVEKIQKYCSRIAEWSGGVQEDNELLLKLNEKDIFIYLLYQEIQKRFPQLEIHLGQSGVIKIRKVNESEIKLLHKRNDGTLKKKLFYSILGFSRIVKEIQNLKKPIIGHNFLIDLIMIYQQFYNPFPVSYKEFKKAITEIFPNIYDTKRISFALREILSRDDTWHSNNLSDLYFYLKKGKGATLVTYTPLINHTNAEYLEEKTFHEAGFDSYCTGFCFLKMAHIFSLWNEKKKTFLINSLPTTTSWLLGAVQFMKNNVNISRGQVDYIVLDDQDPRSFRPGLLFIQSRANQPLDIKKILEIIAKYASVDIQLLNNYSALMAVSNQKQVKDILQCFKNHKEVKVTRYQFFRHSFLGRMIVSGTVVASVILIAMWASKY